MTSKDLILLRQAFRIQRFHTVPLIRSQTVGEHTAGVIALACYLNGGYSEDLMRAALFHDIGEILTGDVPHNVKKDNPDLRRELRRIEAMVLPPGDLNSEQRRALNVADMLECIWKCTEEIQMGNLCLDLVRKRAIGYLSLSSEREREAVKIVTMAGGQDGGL